MKFKNFKINNYRAIEFADLSLNNQLTPLIGINESGKSSVLYAMLAFDKSNDTFKIKDKEGEHLEYKNRYKFGIHQQECIIEMEITFDSIDEVNNIAGELKLSPGSELHESLKSHYEKNEAIIVSRNLETKKYAVKNTAIPIPPDTNETLAEKIVELTPHLLYFKGFDEMVDDKITFGATYDYTKKDTTKGFAEWRNLLSEIFKQEGNGYDLKGFIEINSKSQDEDNVLRHIDEVLNKKILDEWEKLRKIGLSGSDEKLTDLKFSLKHFVNKDNTHEFQFRIIDTSANPSGMTFKINERSIGLMWFFNFIVKLNYNPHYTQRPSEAIYLLDEPGSNLHSSAQSGLLKKLQELSERNRIIFATHSENLLDPQRININAVKIISKRNGNIFVKSFPQAGIRKDEGAFTPIYRALHLKSGVKMFQSTKVIITEGMTDYYFFSMLMKYTKLITANDIQIIPGEGADQLNTLISLAIGSCDKYLVLLDSDPEGKNAYDVYAKSFGDEQKRNFFTYKSNKKRENFLLEDFLSQDDKGRLKEITDVEEIKDAIIALNWNKDEGMIKHFFENLFPETKDNLEIVLNVINGKF